MEVAFAISSTTAFAGQGVRRPIACGPLSFYTATLQHHLARRQTQPARMGLLGVSAIQNEPTGRVGLTDSKNGSVRQRPLVPPSDEASPAQAARREAISLSTGSATGAIIDGRRTSRARTTFNVAIRMTRPMIIDAAAPTNP